jgi:hypothetical protein
VQDAIVTRYAYCLGDPVGHTDPTGAIALWDDDAHVDSYELAAHNYRHSKGAAKKRWRGVAIELQRAWAAKRALAAQARRYAASEVCLGSMHLRRYLQMVSR